MQLADEYADENFKHLCEQSIKRDMTADKVADLLAITRKVETCQVLSCVLACRQWVFEVFDYGQSKESSSLTIYSVIRLSPLLLKRRVVC